MQKDQTNLLYYIEMSKFMSPFVWICTISDSSSILEFYFSLTVDTEPVEMNRMTSNRISFF